MRDLRANQGKRYDDDVAGAHASFMSNTLPGTHAGEVPQSRSLSKTLGLVLLLRRGGGQENLVGMKTGEGAQRVGEGT